jgi:hypothetical protein
MRKMKSEFEKTHRTLLGMAVEAVTLEAALHGPVADYLTRWLAAQYAVAASEQLAGLEGEPRVKALRAFIHDTALLRRGDQNAERLKIERERLEVASRHADLKWKRKVIIGLETLLTYVEHHPKAKAAFDALRESVRHPFDPREQVPPKD